MGKTRDIVADAIAALELQRDLVDGFPLTGDQRSTLQAWPGWGSLASAFAPEPSGKWLHLADQLDSLLTPPARAAAADVVDTAYYTPPEVGQRLWQILTAAGFTGGRVLDLGCGHGALISAAPDGLPIDVTGVEVDPTSARIASLLHSRATIHTGRLQSRSLRDNYFDAVVANVPFSSVNVHDSVHRINLPLHSYFLMRAVRAVRPGGYVVAVTSRFVMDSGTTGSELARHADLVAAVRLPSGTFPGTDVVADVLVLQVRAPGQKASGWIDTVNFSRNPGYRLGATVDERDVVDTPLGEGQNATAVRVNRYWALHPLHVAGAMRVTGNRYNGLAVVTDAPGPAVDAAITSVCSALPAMTAAPIADDGLSDVILVDAQGRKERSFHVVDGQIFTVTDGALVQVQRPARELFDLISLRDAAINLMDLESDPDLPDETIAPARAHALDLYRLYVAAWGALNRCTVREGKPDPETGVPAVSVRRPSMGGFRRDPDYPLVLALEKYDPDTSTAEPAAVLLGRVNKRPVRVERVDTAAEALAVTLGEVGRLDLSRVAELLGLSSLQSAAAALGDLVYSDPQNDGRWTPARDYLSGNVRSKLDAARRAAKLDPAYLRNVAALEESMPTQLGMHDVRVSLGAPWLTPDDIGAFLTEELGTTYTGAIHHSPSIAYWELSTSLRCSPDASVLYGTEDMSPIELLQCGLNGKRPVVYIDVLDDGVYRRVRSPQRTAAAADRLQALHERFSVWIFEDEARRERVLAAYNLRFSSHVTRRPDGSHLTVPGISAGLTLWPHQLDAVDMVLSRPRALIAHAVGAGKTLEMVCSAIMLRRFGLANKPCIAVPKNILEQIGREAQQAAPAARLLIATEEDLARDSRRLFAARCATGDWDAVIMTHEAFSTLGVDPESEAEWIETQKATVREHMNNEPEYGRGARQTANAVRSLEEQLDRLRSNVTDPDQITLEQLGIDYILIDEADKFIRIPVATRADGFSIGSSKRATDMLLKVETLAARYPNRPVVSMFTGTPFRNTLAEIYCWARFMIPDRLDHIGLAHFDAFAHTFIRWETRIEVAPDGSGFRTHTRPSTIQNLPELRGLLNEFADLLPAEALGQKRPARNDHTVVVDPGPQILDYVAGLVRRAENLQNTNSRIRGSDNMLTVCGDGRKVALDPKLVGIEIASPKLLAAAETIASTYRRDLDRTFNNTTPGVLQLALCDLGTPKPDDASTYGRLRQLVVELGVPANRVRFAHEATTPKSREALHAACRDGSVSVLLGSTPKIGIGTNIQTRLSTVHLIAPPWRPSDVEQGEGRAFRPGNLCESVDVFTYVTERTFDAYSWEVLHRKSRAFAHLYSTDSTIREVDDIGDTTLAYAEIKAAASGNVLLLEEAEIKSTVRTLRLRRATHLQNVRRAVQQADQCAAAAERLRRRVTALDELYKDLDDRPIMFDRLVDDIGYLITRPHRSASVGPLTVETETSEGQIVGFTIRHDYTTLADVPVSRSQLRRGAARIAPAVAETLHRLTAPERTESARLQQSIERLRAEEDAARNAATSLLFPDEQTLVAAEARLAAIGAEIADALDSDRQHSQAA